MTARHFTWISKVSAAAVALAAAGCFGAPASLTGQVRIEESLRAQLQPSAVLYVVARSVAGPDAQPSPPLAVKRIPQPIGFPLQFTLTEADVMIPNTPFRGKVEVSARVAQSGSAVPLQAGDLESGAAPIVVELGPRVSAVELVLDRVRN